MKPIRHILSLAILFFLSALLMLALLGADSGVSSDKVEKIRTYTRQIEFDYLGWMANAMLLKVGQVALAAPVYLDGSAQHRLVVQYLDLVNQTEDLNRQITTIYADPNQKDPQAASGELNRQLADINARLDQLGPLAESVLQSQVAEVASGDGLALGGQPLPPVMFHTTELPMALIVSPRTMISQDANLSLKAGMSAQEEDALERTVSSNLNVSALVVPVGGIGVYPTMIMSTADLNWLAEVISHEWTHNYLTLRPLGLNYDTSPELRTMNETTADLVGREIGQEVIRRFYSERVPPPPAPPSSESDGNSAAPSRPVFDYRAEMHTTRVTVDQLLKDGKVTEAETYMETRRRFFRDNGYLIRKLNQAFFAFYGAYNDTSGDASGAAGADPVGPAVVALRQKSRSLVDFLNRISWMTSFADLQAALKK